jgi:murein endopeptidase
LGYFHQGEPPTSFVKASKSNLDFELTWALLMALTEKGAVDYIFIDRNLQKWLHDWALEQKKAPKAKLDALFQHPDGGPNALVRHEPGHLNHMHVRFRCPATDPSCY